MVGDNPAPASSSASGRWTARSDPQDEFFANLSHGHTAAELPERNAADDTACVFCTSGTTGKAKDRDLRSRRVLA